MQGSENPALRWLSPYPFEHNENGIEPSVSSLVPPSPSSLPGNISLADDKDLIELVPVQITRLSLSSPASPVQVAFASERFRRILPSPIVSPLRLPHNESVSENTFNEPSTVWENNASGSVSMFTQLTNHNSNSTRSSVSTRPRHFTDVDSLIECQSFPKGYARDLEKTSENYLCFRIKEWEGGTRSGCIEDVLAENLEYHHSEQSTNVNIILEHLSRKSVCRSSFAIEEVRIKAHPGNASLRSGFLFVLSDLVPLSAFDSYSNIDPASLSRPDAKLPLVPSLVKTILYFRLDPREACFHYRFRHSVPGARFLFIKMLDACSIHQDSGIQVQFIGAAGHEMGPWTSSLGELL